MDDNTYVSVYMHPSAGYYLVQKICKVKKGENLDVKLRGPRYLLSSSCR